VKPAMPTVTFKPFEITREIPAGESLFSAAAAAGVTVATRCGGKGACGLCRVKIVEGAEHLSAFTRTEERHLGTVYFITKERLACQAVVHGDGQSEVTVEVLPDRGRR